jgi:DNA-binding transcriptional regulator YiaG
LPFYKYTVALPFSEAHRTVQKPIGNKYIENPKTLGQQIRNKRVKLGLLQKELARIIGVCEDTITYWEDDRTSPKPKYLAAIKEFLFIVN